MLKKSGALLFFLLSLNICFAQNIVINELLSVNNSGIQDEDGDHSDWIELFNNSDDFVSLEGYFISDQLDNPYLFALPPIDLLPGEFLVVFCSGKDRFPINGELHSNFKISSNEESVLLTDPENNHFTFPVVYNGDNISYGSYPDAGIERIHFDQPTPGHSNTSTNGANQVLFSNFGGIYQDLFSLELSTLLESQEIRFSIDGTAPDSSSRLYTHPIVLSEILFSTSSLPEYQISPDEYQIEAAKHIKKSIVIRAASFDSSGNQTSEIETHTYFIEHLGSIHKHLPIVSICAEMDYLVNDSTGIFVPGINFNPAESSWTGNYYQSGREWERSAHFEFHHPERKSYSSEIGLRTHGGNSRRHPQKGMRLYARSEYGNKKFRYPFYKNQDTQEFKRLVLKPISASWNDSGLQDLIANQMALDEELKLIGLQNEPVVVYINGIYWGVYLLQERIDEHFMEEHFEVEEDEFDLIGNWFGVTNAGSNEEWLQLYDFIATNDMSISGNYEYVSSQIDIDNFIDYQLFEAFIANQDWPANNMMCWKKHGEDSKWQWIFKDGDGGFQDRELNFLNHSLSTSDEFWPTNASTTLFLRKLIENQSFEDQFYTRLAYLINNSWRYQDMSSFYNNAVIDFHDEIIEQNLRFPVIANYSEWLSAIDQVNHFMQVRACNLQSQLSDDLNKTIIVPECYLPETDVNHLEVYPNPSNGSFTLYFESTLSKNLLIKIRNIQGQLIKAFPFPASNGKNRVSLSHLNLPQGLYVIEVKADQHSEVCKLIISE